MNLIMHEFIEKLYKGDIEDGKITLKYLCDNVEEFQQIKENWKEFSEYNFKIEISHDDSYINYSLKRGTSIQQIGKYDAVVVVELANNIFNPKEIFTKFMLLKQD